MKYSTPISILIGSIIIAGAVFYNKPTTNLVQPTTIPVSAKNAPTDSIAAIRGLSTDDHILGDPTKAKSLLVVYSDLECPFCKKFNPTVKTILEENPDMAYVFRPFPIASLHPKALKEAEAAECADDQGKFFDYVDGVFAVTPSNNKLDPQELNTIAKGLSLDMTKFSDCLSSGKYTSFIQSQVDAGKKEGINSTPYAFVVSRDGTVTPIKGAQPIETVRSIIKSIK